LCEPPAKSMLVSGKRKLSLLSTDLRLGNQEFFILPQIFYSEEYSFFGHRPGGTWHGQDVVIVLWLVERPWIILLLGSMFLCALVVKTKRRNILNILSHFPRLSLGKAPQALPSLPLFTSRPRGKNQDVRLYSSEL
jgi:hypothetical protein